MARQSTLVHVRLDGDNSGAIGVPSNNSLERTQPGRDNLVLVALLRRSARGR
jgi:hypothetical protein